MADEEKERKRKALEAMMGGESVRYIGSEFEEKKPEPLPVNRKCSGCGGTGKCTACFGSGAEECPTCLGSGRVGAYHTKVTRGPEHTYVSQASGFGGTCPDCGGRGKKVKGVMCETVKCQCCNGTGKCGKCAGTGSVSS
jgi:RecJ-like exonuclease